MVQLNDFLVDYTAIKIEDIPNIYDNSMRKM